MIEQLNLLYRNHDYDLEKNVSGDSVTGDPVTNITEEVLLQSLETLPHLVWMAKGDGTVFYYNKRIKEFFGAEQLPDGVWKWHGLLHEEDVEPTEAAWKKALETGTVYEKEHRVKMADGSYRWHLSRAFPQKDNKGKIIRWFGTATDIDDQKLFTEKLEEIVQERTAELQRSNEELQQFAHIISHDLKEPLRKIRTFTQLLGAELKDKASEKAVTYFDKIGNAAERMYKMIEEVLEYATATSADKLLGKINLRDTLKNIENDLEVVIRQKGAAINYQDFPLFEGVPVLMHQLFYNLINNSIKFAKAGVPPVITLSSRMVKEKEINEIDEGQERDYVEIIVKDNGIGFAQESAEKIFDAFNRLHSKHQYEGTGLGLALCRKIVQQHHGTITATGKEGEGAVFRIVLPVKQDTFQEMDLPSHHHE